MEEAKDQKEQAKFYKGLAEKLSSVLPQSGYVEYGYNQFQFWCPDPFSKHDKNHKPKLSANFELDVFNCWICGYKGKASVLLEEYAILNSSELLLYDRLKVDKDEDSEIKIERNVVELPSYKKFTGALIKKSISAKKAYSYITKRIECDLNFLTRFEIGIASKVKFKKKSLPTSVLLVPSFDKNGNANYYFYREYIQKYDPGKWNCLEDKKKIIFFESHVDWNKEHIVLVEGPMDSLKLWNCGIQNIPVLGTELSEDWLIFQAIKRYGIKPVIFLDQFADYKAIKMKELFRNNSIKSFVHEPWDAILPIDRQGIEELDPAKLSKEKLMELKAEYDV